MGGRWESRRGIGKGGEVLRPRRDAKGWFTPYVRNPEKYPDCKTDLIGGSGNTDICPGRQTLSCRHWQHEMNTMVSRHQFLE